TSDRQIDRINRLVDELLDVSRINNGKMTLELERVNLAEVVRETASRFLPELRKVGCELQLEVPGEVWGVFDRLRMEQIISNLLTNVMRYAPGAPVELALETDGKLARLCVRDHGMGIAPEDQERIFQRFERAVPMANFGGLGLGLYIVRQILTSHGGAI